MQRDGDKGTPKIDIEEIEESKQLPEPASSRNPDDSTKVKKVASEHNNINPSRRKSIIHKKHESFDGGF